MTKRGIVILALTILALAAIFSTAAATEVRVGTMGGVGFYMHDNSNIFFFPGAIYSYSGQVYGELRVPSTPDAYTVGVNYPIGDYSVVGLYLNRPMPVSIPVGVLDSVQINQTTDLFYGTQMSKFDLGFKLSLGLDSYSRDSIAETPKMTQSARYIQFAAGASTDKMDAAVSVELPHAKFEESGVTDTWSGFGFGAVARCFHGEGPTKLVPLINFNTRKINGKSSLAGSGKEDFSDLNFGLGIGVNHQLNENNLVVGAVEILGLQSSKDKVTSGGTPSTTTTTTLSRMTLPGLYMGVESNIRPWLTGRLGAEQVWQISKTKNEETGVPSFETKAHSSQYNVVFGLGLHFSDFTVDAAINEDIFFDGPNFISGQTNSLANRLAVVYKF
jgi:hypothetical protein